MDAYRFKVTIPEDHRLFIKLPEHIPTGPAELLIISESAIQEEQAVDDRSSTEQFIR